MVNGSAAVAASSAVVWSETSVIVGTSLTGVTVSVNVSLAGNQAAFFANMNRPSGVLSTDEKLKRDELATLREAFDARSKDINAGGLPILSHGLKFQPMHITSQDAQLIEAQRSYAANSKMFQPGSDIMDILVNLKR